MSGANPEAWTSLSIPCAIAVMAVVSTALGTSVVVVGEATEDRLQGGRGPRAHRLEAEGNGTARRGTSRGGGGVILQRWVRVSPAVTTD